MAEQLFAALRRAVLAHSCSLYGALRNTVNFNEALRDEETLQMSKNGSRCAKPESDHKNTGFGADKHLLSTTFFLRIDFPPYLPHSRWLEAVVLNWWSADTLPSYVSPPPSVEKTTQPTPQAARLWLNLASGRKDEVPASRLHVAATPPRRSIPGPGRKRRR